MPGFRAGILRSTRGVRGGVALARDPSDITLLEIFEACQGILTAGYCRNSGSGGNCSFHEAMGELHDATTSVLARWTLADLLRRPAWCPADGESDCRMFFEGCRDLLD